MTNQKPIIIALALLFAAACGAPPEAENQRGETTLTSPSPSIEVEPSEHLPTEPTVTTPKKKPAASQPTVAVAKQKKKSAKTVLVDKRGNATVNPTDDQTVDVEEPVDTEPVDTAPVDDEDEPQPDLPEWVEMRDLTFAGTGCPAGSADLDYLHDGQTMELTSSELRAFAYEDSSRRDRRRACQILVLLDHSEGWQYAIDTVALTAHAEISATTLGEIVVSTYIQGDAETETVSAQLDGPLYESLDLEASPTTDIAWSPCDRSRALNVKVDVRVTGLESGEPEGLLEIGNPLQVKLQWRRCE